ncbi:MAG: sialidase family protein [Phycisphaerales bacterium]
MRSALMLAVAPGACAWAQPLVLESGSDAMDPAPPAPLVLRAPPVVVEGPFVSVQVNTDAATGLDILNDAGNEPSIARSLTDPDVFIIGWRQFDSVSSSYRKAGYAYTHDDGATWSGKHVLDDTRQGSDPILAAGPDGEIYYNTYRFTGNDHTEVYATTDGGLNWAGPWDAVGGDKAWMTVDTTDGPNRGMLYQYWTSNANVSVDGGQTWSSSASTSTAWGTMDVGPDGRAYMVGGRLALVQVDQDDPANPPLVTTLNDLPFYPPTFIVSSPVNPGGLEGQTDVDVNTAPGPHDNEVYVLQSARGLSDGPILSSNNVYFAWSADGGVTLSEAIRVNDDPIDTAWHWFGTFAVAPNGRLDAIWNDTRHDPNPLDDPLTSRLYASYSTDGGRTWAPNFPVSPSFEHRLGYPSNQTKLGDYYDMVGDNLGAHVAYAATFTGGQDVYCLRLGTTDCDGNGVPDEMEIAAGLASDVNRDWILDSCQCLADLTGDGSLNLDDIDAFATAFIGGDPTADIVADGVLNLDDIAVFAASFVAGCP